ncbi:MAG: hypothetical protein IPN34_01400 [Planctomycetes bacterium]|nr:hypothetical protein [Planctomycetota bacterium]
MLALCLALLLQPALDPAPRVDAAELERALARLDARAWVERESAQARLSLAPRAQLAALWDRARRGQLSAAQRARLRVAIEEAPRRGGAVSLAACELGEPVFAAPPPEHERLYREWAERFPARGALEDRRRACSFWDGRGEDALHFLERGTPPEPELARWMEASSRRLRLELHGIIE